MCLHYLGKCSVLLGRKCNKVYGWMINWIATNTTDRYVQSQKKSHVSYHVIFITTCAKNARLQHERKRVYADDTRRQHVKWPRDAERPIRCWCVVSVRLGARFWYERLAYKAHSTRCSQPYDSRFSMSVWSRNNILSWHIRCQYAFTVVNGQNTSSAFHKVV